MRSHSGPVALIAQPVAGLSRPGFVEEAALAEGRAHEPEGAAADGEHGANGFVEVVGDARGFIDEQERDGGEAADGGFGAGEPDDARAVGQQERDGVVAVAARADSEPGDTKCEALRTNSPLCRSVGLTTMMSDSDVERTVHGFDGGEGGLAPLARAVENAAAGVHVEHGSL